ncbi:HEAT repeat domain-containing protein [Roseomonas sp. PWR1]|uniref:HEAT repeat domain-containing protein n=1 Tax=Roseomonas nitratireducens TaxID=2820810 RepID=A0ABS4ARD4_9PROT|nr:HEAT repeat domain-containing protein [Neoroseomonas nitratireducens]MBP0463930.1 HEAT repeat domain-containing protein [Neoroseomonas nitratireducens]
MAFDRDAPPDRRREAALACAGDVTAAPALLAALPGEPVAVVRDAIVTALAATGDPAAAEGLAALVGSEDAALRNAALDGLRRMPAEVALPPLLGLLGRPDADLRLLATGVLSAFPAGTVRGTLHAVLAQDPEANVGLAAVEVLAQAGSIEDADALRGFAARFEHEPMVRFAVRAALGQIGAAP